MSEMIKRVAAAIYKSQEWDFASDENFDDLTDGCKDVFETAARAAIEAMREPTKEMIEQFEGHKVQEAAAWHWGWMLSVALATEPAE